MDPWASKARNSERTISSAEAASSISTAVVALGYMMATESAIEKPFGNEGLNLPSSGIIRIIDPFLKNLLQAFAEQSVGEVYVIVPKGVEDYDMVSGTKEWT